MGKLKVLYLSRFFDLRFENGIRRRLCLSLESLAAVASAIDCIFLSRKEIEPSAEVGTREFLKAYNVRQVKLLVIPKILSLSALLSAFRGRYYSILYGSRQLTDLVRSIYPEGFQDYDLIFYNYFYLTPFVDLLDSGRVKKVVDLIDAVSLHMDEARQIFLPRRLFYNLVRNEVLELERESLRKADLCFITTEHEKRSLLRDESSDLNSKVVVVGNYVDDELINYGRDTYKKYETEKNKFTLAFIGELSYYPNVQAVIRLLKIYREFFNRRYQTNNKQIRLLIVGPNATKKLQRLVKIYGKYSVELRGYVQDLKLLSDEVDVFVFPMKIASGVQNKLLTGLALGIPTIISRRARFQDELVDGVNVLFADTDEEFLEKLDWCFENTSKLGQISLKANEFARNNLIKPIPVSKLCNAIADLF